MRVNGTLMSIDVTKFRSSVKRLSKDAKDQRARTNLTDVVRKLLPEIQRLRDEEKVNWSILAAGLAEQGLVEGPERKPVSEKRLTSIVAKLKAQSAKKAGRDQARLERSDMLPATKPQAHPIGRSGRSLLAPELRGSTPTEDNPPLSEDEIRRAQTDKHSHLFKKD